MPSSKSPTPTQFIYWKSSRCGNCTKTANLCKRDRTIILFITAGNSNDQQNRTPVSKKKLTQLWKENQKKAIEIINNSDNWPYRIVTVVDKDKTEEHYHGKYNFDKQDLKPILN